jgi:hypothetical protein
MDAQPAVAPSAECLGAVGAGGTQAVAKVHAHLWRVEVPLEKYLGHHALELRHGVERRHDRLLDALQQIGSKHPIAHVKQDQAHPIHCSNEQETHSQKQVLGVRAIEQNMLQFHQGLGVAAASPRFMLLDCRTDLGSQGCRIRKVVC